MRYRAMDGAEYEARNATDLVRQLRLVFTPRGRTQREFMREAAKRARAWNGTRINITNPDLFVRGLIRCGFLQELENDRD
jgi:hypothetical protein